MKLVKSNNRKRLFGIGQGLFEVLDLTQSTKCSLINSSKQSLSTLIFQIIILVVDLNCCLLKLIWYKIYRKYHTEAKPSFATFAIQLKHSVTKKNIELQIAVNENIKSN